MKKKKVFDKEKGQRRIKNTVHNNNATDRVSPKSSTKSITDADTLNPGMITGVQYIINSSLLFARSNIEAGSKIGDLPNHVYFSAIERIAHRARIADEFYLPEQSVFGGGVKKIRKKGQVLWRLW